MVLHEGGNRKAEEEKAWFMNKIRGSAGASGGYGSRTALINAAFRKGANSTEAGRTTQNADFAGAFKYTVSNAGKLSRVRTDNEEEHESERGLERVSARAWMESGCNGRERVCSWGGLGGSKGTVKKCVMVPSSRSQPESFRTRTRKANRNGAHVGQMAIIAMERNETGHKRV
jgi:hypothetical protein